MNELLITNQFFKYTTNFEGEVAAIEMTVEKMVDDIKNKIVR